MRISAVLSCFVLVILVSQNLRADPPAAEFRSGHWVPIAPPTSAPPPSDPQLDRIQQLLDTHDPQQALHLALDWVKGHPNKAPQRDRCLYLIALAKYAIPAGENHISAFYYCDELMDEYPDSRLFYDALALQYRIANDFLNGYKTFFLGLPIIGQEDTAEEMLYRIQQRSPGSPLAEKALLRTCDFYYSTGQYQLAHDAYGYYIKSYPRSPKLGQIKLRQAFSSLAQFRGVRFDPTCLIDARAELNDVIAGYPELAREQNLKGLIARIDVSLARKLLVTGDYFRRTGAMTGAVYMYRYLILTYPDSPDSATARENLKSMPATALAVPPPQIGFNMPAGAQQ